MIKEPYRPIPCDFHSELELLALRHTAVDIRYRGNDGEVTLVHSAISDLYARNGEEFLLLPGQVEIRLDKLISVNGLCMSDFC